MISSTCSLDDFVELCNVIAKPVRKFLRARPIDLVEGIRRLASSRGAPV